MAQIVGSEFLVQIVRTGFWYRDFGTYSSYRFSYIFVLQTVGTDETLNPKPPNLTLTIRPEKLNPNSKPNKIKHDNL